MLIWMTSALYVYEFFEMFHAVCLFPTVPQFETLEYAPYFGRFWNNKMLSRIVVRTTLTQEKGQSV